MRHEAGMATTEYPVERIDCLPENIKKNVLGEKLAGWVVKIDKTKIHQVWLFWNQYIFVIIFFLSKNGN